jgi:hypothetical protein
MSFFEDLFPSNQTNEPGGLLPAPNLPEIELPPCGPLPPLLPIPETEPVTSTYI